MAGVFQGRWDIHEYIIYHQRPIRSELTKDGLIEEKVGGKNGGDSDGEHIMATDSKSII